VVLVEEVEMKRPLELDMIMMELGRMDILTVLTLELLVRLLELLVVQEVMVLQLDALVDSLLLLLMMVQ
tara:strand:+ start:492 stop:698 length:207 start_codon:yes stop_codon:yes gene_type:complete